MFAKLNYQYLRMYRGLPNSTQATQQEAKNVLICCQTLLHGKAS